MFEIMRWISMGCMWVATALNVFACVVSWKAYKRAKAAKAKADAIVFQNIRKNGKHVILAEGGKLCEYCQHDGEGCGVAAGMGCTRFLPKEGTNLTSFDGVVETPPDVGTDEFSDLFVDWIESKGWLCCAVYKPYVDDLTSEEK